MRIAQLAPLFESVPPTKYGGTERVVSWLTEALVELGHDVTLFASSDSKTSARLFPSQTCSLRSARTEKEYPAHHQLMINEAIDNACEFDIIHSHLDYLAFPSFRANNLKSLHTMHGRLDLPELVDIFDRHKEVPVVSISNNQRKPILEANWKATVYHGLPQHLYNYKPRPTGRYLLFLGRICPEKGIASAIEIARLTGLQLKIAAKVDPVDEEYFRQQIEPLIEKYDLDFFGEATDLEKNELIGNALALVFPINWPEPFGLVMIEAMACGTPIVAFGKGSVPEIIKNGENGFICEDVQAAVKAIENIDVIDRLNCRYHFDSRFTASRMAQDYARIYEKELCTGKNRVFSSPSSIFCKS